MWVNYDANSPIDLIVKSDNYKWHNFLNQIKCIFVKPNCMIITKALFLDEYSINIPKITSKNAMLPLKFFFVNGCRILTMKQKKFKNW